MRYALAVDTRDFDGVGACFTPGATAFYSGVQLRPGVEHIVAHISGIAHFVQSQHIFGASLSRSTATGRPRCRTLPPTWSGPRVTATWP